MIYKNDWRLKRQRKYLQGIKLQWKEFRAYRSGSESDHCEFCWAKFQNVQQPDVLREGYASEDNYYWICRNCFDDFHEMFQWQVG
jgi:hypothetical protein